MWLSCHFIGITCGLYRGGGGTYDWEVVQFQNLKGMCVWCVWYVIDWQFGKTVFERVRFCYFKSIVSRLLAIWPLKDCKYYMLE
jgi:hypothetical protein